MHSLQSEGRRKLARRRSRTPATSLTASCSEFTHEDFALLRQGWTQCSTAYTFALWLRKAGRHSVLGLPRRALCSSHVRAGRGDSTVQPSRAPWGCVCSQPYSPHANFPPHSISSPPCTLYPPAPYACTPNPVHALPRAIHTSPPTETLQEFTSPLHTHPSSMYSPCTACKLLYPMHIHSMHSRNVTLQTLYRTSPSPSLHVTAPGPPYPQSAP